MSCGNGVGLNRYCPRQSRCGRVKAMDTSKPHDTRRRTTMKKTGKDDNLAFDYVADVLCPSMVYSREALAVQCMEAIFKDGSGVALEEYHFKASRLLETLAVRLMGEEWCQKWMKDNVYPKP